MTWFAELAATIEQAAAIEQAWLSRRAGARADQRNTGWMPLPLFEFAGILFEAIPAIASQPPDVRPRLLEVGAGPGGKLLLARDGYGFDVSGIEIDDEMAAAARELGLNVQTADAVTWKGYGDAEAVCFNRVLRDAGAELELEQRVWREMAPGAVAVCANLESRPPSSWFIVLDAWDSDHRGAWMKPPRADVSVQ
jgi:hypothetical protein